MADLIAPVSIRALPERQQDNENLLLQLLRDIRTELRVMNMLLEVNLNSVASAEDLRKDPYYHDPNYPN